MTVRAGLQRLDYRALLGAVSGQDLTDDVTSYGGGIDYRLERDVRIGFNVDRESRTSRETTRQYSGVRCTTSLTYQF